MSSRGSSTSSIDCERPASLLLQEDIAERMGTSGQHVNMVQGLTLLVQALSAIPCMFLCGEFDERSE
ncbi:hypothetical protein E2C01_058230 [Portunus trituberculatus]|uniref:Uncharacterized protein n=1 Tax=Portunus trituberculatus TaxID=210409 RepID=A0A5B7H2F2_PORTR|nr:hypothetical protein [Portunus trituberculatus]